MNDWQKRAQKATTFSENLRNSGKIPNQSVPETLTDSSWKREKAGIPRCKSPYQPFPESARRDEYYNRYMALSQNVADRYPDPGAPRERQGAIGGSWRHVKEVLGHGGSRTIFIDGLVSLYDMDMDWLRKKESPAMRQVSNSSFGVTRNDVDSYKATCQRELEQKSYKPWEHENDVLPPINDTTRELPGEPSKHKGFYSMR